MGGRCCDTVGCLLQCNQLHTCGACRCSQPGRRGCVHTRYTTGSRVRARPLAPGRGVRLCGPRALLLMLQQQEQLRQSSNSRPSGTSRRGAALVPTRPPRVPGGCCCANTGTRNLHTPQREPASPSSAAGVMVRACVRTPRGHPAGLARPVAACAACVWGVAAPAAAPTHARPCVHARRARSAWAARSASSRRCAPPTQRTGSMRPHAAGWLQLQLGRCAGHAACPHARARRALTAPSSRPSHAGCRPSTCSAR